MELKIAILIASYNRKIKTITCINQILNQDFCNDFRIEIFLTDDASNDGTFDSVKTLFPQVHLFMGTGSLFWAGGMRNSWRKAIEHELEFDYYLLINDDTFLYKDSILKLINQSKSFFNLNNKHAVVIGTTINPDTGKITYGGRKLYSKFRPSGYLINDSELCLECDLGEANIMLVHTSIVAQIGILSDSYTHGIADYDYSLTAKKNGFKVIVAPGIFGTCLDDHGKNWKSADTSLKERISFLYSPKGLAYKEYLLYIKKHFPFHIPEAIFKLWLKTLFPFVYDKLKQD
ncbi:MAG TPA: glycosyltransferase [Lunatimonas sp.]|nr:glycosyltransferase [Lunatimonas sp.]